MPPHVIPVMDVGRQITPQGFEKPRGMLPVKIAHVVAERPFKFPVGLRVVHRRVFSARDI